MKSTDNDGVLGAARHEPALRIAMLAPPTLTVPPDGYGGTERVVSQLSDELVRRGHEVELFCPPGSRSLATVRPVLDRPHPEAIGRSLYDADHVNRGVAMIEAAERPFDVIHDHSGYAAVPMADRIRVPMVHTMHWHLHGDYARFYNHHGHKAHLVALSEAQLGCANGRCRHGQAPFFDVAATVIPNSIDLTDWPLVTEKEDYLLFLGRLSEAKGPHRAIEVARRSGRRLVLAGRVFPEDAEFVDEEVRPHLDGERIRFVGEVGGAERQRLYARAGGFLMPIRRCEPFGLVMLEALAAGTPVIAFAEGAAAEIVQPGRNGFLVDDEEAMAEAIGQLPSLDPSACRASVEERYSIRTVADAYEALYRRVARRAAS